MININKANKTVMIIAGGTGGHVFPGLSVANVLMDHGYNVVWLGTANNIESKLVPLYEIDIKFIYIQSWRGKKIYKKIIILLFFIIFSMYQSLKIIRYWKPDIVLSMGGYVSGPSGLMAWLCGIPLIIHEQNRIIGLTNRCLSFFAKKILQGFPNTIPNAITVGNPIRCRISSIPDPDSRWLNRIGPIRILVIGGSQGASIFNQVIPKIAKKLINKLMIWHQSGKTDFNNVVQAYQEMEKNLYKIESFINDIDQAYSWADLIISRSGALTVSEIACVGLPAIFVPFMYHEDRHQYWNADLMVEIGAAKIIEEKEFTIDYVSAVLESLNRQDLLNMAKRARTVSISHATQLVVNTIIQDLK